jgi:hypothetical protein
MRSRCGRLHRRLAAACLIAGAVVLSIGAATASAQTIPPRPQQLGSYWITYYWFAPEAWFTAKKMVAPGLKVAYREDFLYSARGISMQGTGTGDDNVMIHWRSGRGAWVNKEGAETQRLRLVGEGSCHRQSEPRVLRQQAAHLRQRRWHLAEPPGQQGRLHRRVQQGRCACRTAR